MKTIQGNLLDFPNGINAIFHQANTENIMGAGIAKQIRERYPEAYETDTNFFIPKGEYRLGEYSFASVNDENSPHRLVYNLYGQRLGKDSIWGIPTDYFALRDSLNKALYEHTTFFDYYDKIICGFPWLLGSNLGGGDFKIVKYIVEQAMERYSLTGYWVKYAV
jgi:YD repeat-containing protein